ncbi:MAG: hypothetical protein R2794_11425 [Chitinophagales bacterium]
MESSNEQKADELISNYEQGKALDEHVLGEALSKLKTARIIFYVIGAFQAIMGFVFYTQQPAPVNAYTLGVSLFIAAIFIALGYFTMKKPVLSVTIGLVLYCLLIVLDIVMSPETFYRGMLMRVIFIAALVKAMHSARAAEQIRETYNSRFNPTDKPLDMI